jgi:hypothetical protein
MVHSGYEASAVDDTFGSVRGLAATVKGMLFSRHPNSAAREALGEPAEASRAKSSGPVALTVSAKPRETAEV